MKISSGVLKGRKIKTRNGFSTRPLLTRVRKSLFDILGDNLKGEKFLDLYAGSGAVGIEALSKGAQEAVFVEIDPQCIRIIKENLYQCGMLKRARVYQDDVLRILPLLLKKENFPFIFIGPPYFQDLQNKTLKIIQEFPYLEANLIIQHSPLEKVEFEHPQFEILSQRKYGDTLLTFIYKKGE